MNRLVIVDASVEPGESERFVLSLPAAEQGLHVLCDEEPTAAMIEHLGERISSVRQQVPPSGRREKALLEASRDVIDRARAEPAWRVYDARLQALGLPTLDGFGLELRWTGIYPALCRIEAIRHALGARAWDRVEVFTTHGTMKTALDLARRSAAFSGEGNETISPSRSSKWRRLRKAIGRRLRWAAGPPMLLAEFLGCCLKRERGGAPPQPRRNEGPYVYCVRPLETGLYIGTLAPLIRRAEPEGRALVLLDWRGAGALTAKSLGLTTRHPSEFFTPGDYLRTLGDLARLWTLWIGSGGEARAADAMTYQGQSLRPLVDAMVDWAWFRQVFWQAVGARALRRIIEAEGPRGLVLSVDFSSEAAASANVASEAGIASFYVQPALISDSGRFDTLTAHHALLMDAFSRDVLRARGVGEDRLHVMGLTRWDGLYARRPMTPAEEIRRRLSLAENQPLVFFAGSHGPIAEKTGLIAVVLSIVEAVPAAHICVKPHPNDQVTDYTDCFPRYPAGVFSLFPSGVDMHDLILAADLTVTGFSNVAIEAAILDRPVLAINLRGEPDVIPFEEEGMAMAARSAEDVKTQAARFFGDADFRESLKSGRDRYFERNPQFRTPDVTGRILAKMDELTRRAAPPNGANES